MPTILYTTRSGAAAKAGEKEISTVVGHLATALRDSAKFTAFLNAIYPNTLNRTTICLREWVHYGVAHFQAEYFEQSPELKLGDCVTLETVVAQRVGGNLAAPKNPQMKYNFLSDSLTAGGGDFDLKHDSPLSPGGVLITRNPNKQIAKAWVSSRLGPDSGLEPLGRCLELEYLTERGKMPPNTSGMHFVFNPIYSIPNDPGHYYNFAIGRRSIPQTPQTQYDPANTPQFQTLFGQLYKAYLPLIPPRNGTASLDSFGVASVDLNTWPADASVRILRMNLLPIEQIPPPYKVSTNAFAMNLDLYPGPWFPGDFFPAQGKLETKLNGKMMRLTPEPNKGKSRAGALITPSLYVPSGYQLRLVLNNSDKEAGELFVDLLRESETRKPEEKFLDNVSVKVPAYSPLTKDLPIKNSGWVNYLSLSTSAKGLEIQRIALVKDPKAK